jgi:hypothetical protein
LVVEREVVAPGDGGEPGWWVTLEDTPGWPAWMPKLRYAALCGTPAMARRSFAKRQRALRAAGYERVG